MVRIGKTYASEIFFSQPSFPKRLFSQRLAHNVFLITSFSQRISLNVYLTTSFSQRLSNNVFLTMSFSQRLSINDFLTMSFLQRLSHNVFLTTSFSQRISYSVFVPPLPLYNHPHQVILSTSKFMRNLSVLYKYPKISQIRLSSNPRNFANFLSIKLKPRRCTSAIYIHSLCEVLGPQDRGFIPKSRGQSVV